MVALFGKLVSCNWLSLGFDFLTLGVYRLRFCLLTQAASQVAEKVKCLPAMWETQVQSLGQEDPLEKEMEPTLVLLPGKFHEERSLVGYTPQGLKESDTTEQLHFCFYFFQLCDLKHLG